MVRLVIWDAIVTIDVTVMTDDPTNNWLKLSKNTYVTQFD